MVEVKKEVQKEEPKEKYAIAEIATQRTPFIVDTTTEEVYNELAVLCKIMNDVEELRNELVGKK